MSLCENKGADQLHGQLCAADQHLCFHYTVQSLYFLNPNIIIFCACTARFVLDLVGNPEDRFSCDVEHINKLRQIQRLKQKVPCDACNTNRVVVVIDLIFVFSTKQKPEDQWSCKRSPDIRAYCKNKNK